MCLSITSPFLLLVVLLLAPATAVDRDDRDGRDRQLYATNAAAGLPPPPPQLWRSLRQGCSYPGKACIDWRGNSRPCCRGPDACPVGGICPGGGGREPLNTEDGAAATTNLIEPTSSTPESTATSSSSVYEFAVLGDIPYSPYELCGIPYELNKMPSNAKFLIHLGDLLDGKEGDCASHRYTDVANAFRNSPIPVHFIMGENEFNQCPEGETWAYQQWVDSGLLTYGDRASGPTVVRGSSLGYGDEYYYFVDGNILFIGLSLPGDAPRTREEASVDWTNLVIERNSNVAAVVLFGHAARSGYLSGLNAIAQQYDYLHFLMLNDSHRYEIEYPLEGLSNVKLVRADDTITPMSIVVDVSRSNTNSVFITDRRCYCTTDHRPTRIVQWSSEACRDACRDVHTACAAVETCSPSGSALISPAGGLATCSGDDGCTRFDGGSNAPFCS